jgi:hypothetical protein
MAGNEQATLPFPSKPEIKSVLSLDGNAILEGSLAVEGFNWDGLTGEVFEDGGVCFHDGTEIDVSDRLHPRQFITPTTAIEMIKIAHDIKVGRIAAEER